MTSDSIHFPRLPDDTARSAKETFHIENLYMAIGDQIETLFAGIDPVDFEPGGSHAPTTLARQALTTIFQFAEDLPDRLAAEAVRTRMDWKYALHLPLVYPGIEPGSLCEFRMQLLGNSAAQTTFRVLLERVAAIGLLGSREKRGKGVLKVLARICNLSRIDQMIEAMRAALQALAACHPEWLRAIILPYWYNRYINEGNAPIKLSAHKNLVELAQVLGSDIQYLLKSVEEARLPELASLPEVRRLRQVLCAHFELLEDEPSPERGICWRAKCEFFEGNDAVFSIPCGRCHET